MINQLLYDQYDQLCFFFSETENCLSMNKEKFKSQKKRIKKIKQKLISK